MNNSNNKSNHAILWAIRHKPTGYFILKRKGDKGYTWSEPKEWVVNGDFPRFFSKEKTAKTALTIWLRGTQHAVSSMNNPLSGMPDFDIKTTSVPTRIGYDMEIVKVELRVI